MRWRRQRSCVPVEDFKETRKKRNKNWPPLLPRHRPRALTFPIPSQPENPNNSWNPFRQQKKQRKQQQTFDQSQSMLVGRLPIEIRRLIWVEFLGGQLLHLVRFPKRLAAIPCDDQSNIVINGNDTSWHGCWGFAFFLSEFYHGRHRPANFLPLLQTCRIVYTEATAILYEENIFEINNPDTVLFMQRTLLPRRLTQIRFIKFAWEFGYGTSTAHPPYDLHTWQQACNALAGFTGLRELTMHLRGERGGSVERWEPILESLTCITAKTKFDVYLPSTDTRWIEVGEERGYNFRLRVARPIHEYF